MRTISRPATGRGSLYGLSELKGISITAGDYGSAACTLLSGDCGGEKVVRLEPRGFGVCEPKGGDKIWQDISCSINSSSNTRPL